MTLFCWGEEKLLLEKLLMFFTESLRLIHLWENVEDLPATVGSRCNNVAVNNSFALGSIFCETLSCNAECIAEKLLKVLFHDHFA